MELRLYGIKLGEIERGVDLPSTICETADRDIGGLKDGDIIVIASKVISKAKGYTISKPDLSTKAKILSLISGKPPQLAEAIIRNSKRIFAVIPIRDILRDSNFPKDFTDNPDEALRLLNMEGSILLTETPDGRLAADAGIDMSNAPDDILTYPPHDPDMEAAEIRRRIKEERGIDVAVIISDTEINIFRYGSIDIAIGCSGIDPVKRGFASPDRYGKRKFGGVDIVADEIASAAALLMGQSSEGVPVVVVRGLSYNRSEEGIKHIVIERRLMVKGFILTLLKSTLSRLCGI